MNKNTAVKKGLCGMCRSQCAIEATIKDGKIDSVAADPDSPRGYLCPRGKLAPAVIYGHDRLLKPLVRTGKKGSGQFREATWDEALDIAAKGFLAVKEKYGPRALASYFGQGVLEATIDKAGDSFFANLGSPNDLDRGSICFNASRIIAPMLTIGMGMDATVPDIEHSEIVFSWGKNSYTDDGPARMYSRIREMQKRGGKLVLIDPRREAMNSNADIWIPLMPGSDGALTLAMLKIIIEEERYDKSIAEDFTLGFDEFRQYLKKQKLSKLLKYCGISEKMLRELTDLFCSTTKASFITFTGVEYQPAAVQATRMIYLLWALTGKLDVEGGMYISKTGLSEHKLYVPDKDNLPLGADKYPVFTAYTKTGLMSDLPDAVLKNDPYPVRGLLMVGGSPMVTFPESRTWAKTYKKLDFMVVLDRYMTEDACYADVILPVSTRYETASVLDLGGMVQLRDPLIEPVGGTMNDIFVLQKLAGRMGFGDRLPDTNEKLQRWYLEDDALYRKLRKSDDLTVRREKAPVVYEKYKKGLVRKDGKPGFPTPSGKIEIKSTVLEKYGYKGIPDYRDMRETIKDKDLNKEYPLTMTSGARTMVRIGSFGQNIPEMAAKEAVRPMADISTEDASAYGIKDGERIRVVSPFGSKVFYTRITEMTPGSIHIPYGGGSRFMSGYWARGNVNDLCSLRYRDYISGFPIIKDIPCRIEKYYRK